MNTFKTLVILVGILISLSALEGLFQNEDRQKKDDDQESKSLLSPSFPPSLPSVTPSPKSNITVIPLSPTPILSNNNSSYIYPGSTVIFSTEVSYELRSGDDPNTITNWYKEKINSQDFGVKSHVSTKTNGNVLNKISARGITKIDIEIKKENNSSNTFISVRF